MSSFNILFSDIIAIHQEYFHLFFCLMSTVRYYALTNFLADAVYQNTEED